MSPPCFLGHERRRPEGLLRTAEGNCVRSINLLKIAAEAEALRLRALLARQGRRAAFGASALVFVLAVLALAQIAGWQTLRLYVASIPATLILLGINLVIAGILGVLAARSSPSHAEREALRVRREALDGARGALSSYGRCSLAKASGTSKATCILPLWAVTGLGRVSHLAGHPEGRCHFGPGFNCRHHKAEPDSALVVHRNDMGAERSAAQDEPRSILPTRW